MTASLEVQRTDKVIGSSLEAAPIVYVQDDALREALASVDFADVCITSDLTLSKEPAPEDAFALAEDTRFAVVFAKAQGQKCQRSWKIQPDVGTYNWPGVTKRCSDALDELAAQGLIDKAAFG